MYALLLASGEIPGFLDWNNNYGDEKDKCVCTHCSNYPKSFMGRDVEISELDILGESLGRENCFGAIKGHVAAGPMTYFRVSTDDRTPQSEAAATVRSPVSDWVRWSTARTPWDQCDVELDGDEELGQRLCESMHVV